MDSNSSQNEELYRAAVGESKCRAAQVERL